MSRISPCGDGREHIIATGGYDEHICVWDLRRMGGRAQPVCKRNVGGGVWRLKWHPSPARSSLLLAACMRGHIQILNIDGLGNSDGAGARGGAGGGDSSAGLPTHAAHARRAVWYKGHESEALSYGVDWCYLPQFSQPRDPVLVGSCSFYDQSFHLWGAHPR